MPIDFDALLNGPILDIFGNATFDLHLNAGELVINMRGEFRREPSFIESDDGRAETSTRQPMLAIRSSEFPPAVTVTEDDLIDRLVCADDPSVLPHHNYRVIKVDPDATGLVWLTMHRIS